MAVTISMIIEVTSINIMMTRAMMIVEMLVVTWFGAARSFRLFFRSFYRKLVVLTL